MRERHLVFCVDCDNVETYSRKQPTYAWLCLRFPKQPRGAISPKILDVDAPYERCIDVNRFNHCNEFLPQKDKENASTET